MCLTPNSTLCTISWRYGDFVPGEHRGRGQESRRHKGGYAVKHTESQPVHGRLSIKRTGTPRIWPCKEIPLKVAQAYISALAYELISQFRLTSSNCGVVHSIFPPSKLSAGGCRRLRLAYRHRCCCPSRRRRSLGLPRYCRCSCPSSLRLGSRCRSGSRTRW